MLPAVYYNVTDSILTTTFVVVRLDEHRILCLRRDGSHEVVLNPYWDPNPSRGDWHKLPG